VRVRVLVCACAHVCMCTRVHVHACACARVCMCTRVHVHVAEWMHRAKQQSPPGKPHYTPVAKRGKGEGKGEDGKGWPSMRGGLEAKRLSVGSRARLSENRKWSGDEGDIRWVGMVKAVGSPMARLGVGMV
jgi:hypothetical protein